MMGRYKKTIPNKQGLPQLFGVEEHDDHIALCAYMSDETQEVDIPSEISGKPVTVIAGDCFFNHGEITSISFPNTLRVIETQAFALCKGIKELELPNSIIDIGTYAFRDCKGLRKIILPTSLKVLKAGVFAFCYLPDDAEIVLNEGLEVIERGAFSGGGLNQFFKVRLPNSVKHVYADAFESGVRIITDYNYGERWFVSPRETCLTELLSKETLRDNIIVAYRQMSEADISYSMGMITTEELYRLFKTELENSFFTFLNKKKIQYSVTQNNWPQFQEDYRHWIQGLPLDDENDSPWLILPRTTDEIEIWEKSDHDDQPAWAREYIALSASDKAAFFDLTSAFGIPLDYFEPPAADVIFDGRKAGIPSGAYGEGDPYTILSKWVDVGNLLQDSSPMGKTFTLVSDLGLNAVVTIEEKAESQDILTLVGKGSIEGYTTEKKRQIRISVDGRGNAFSVQYLSFLEDEALHSKYPLWQKGIEYRKMKHAMWGKLVDDLLQRFCYIRMAQEAIRK